MLSYVRNRLLLALPVIFGVCTLTFLLIHFVPGDPVELMLGEQASATDKANLRHDLGLDRPVLEQYWSFIVNTSQLDFGKSLRNRRSVSQLIVERLGATFELALGALLLALCWGIPLGVLASIRQYSWADNGVLFFGLLGMSSPGFFLGPLLVWVFAIQLPWFPVSERGGIEHLVLPSLSLALPLGAVLMRMTRASMLEVIHKDYIRTAKSKGQRPFAIYFKHALSNALMPIITVVGLQMGSLLTGVVVTETIFDWPGLGSLLFGAIQQRDYPLVQGCILFVASTYVLVNLITDLAYALANPTVRLS